MPTSAKSTAVTAQALHQIAVRLPDTQEGVACAGTSLERRTIKVGDKAFLFLGDADARLKLRDSLPEAASLAAAHADLCTVGASGWVWFAFTQDRSPPFQLLKRWIEESYRQFAPKQIADERPAKSQQAGTKKRPIEKKLPKPKRK